MSKKRNNQHIRWVRMIHSYSALAVLIATLFFALTGITLNHPDWLPNADAPIVQQLDLPLPFLGAEQWENDAISQGERLRHWLAREFGLKGNKVAYEWSADEQLLLIDVKRPGGYSIIEVDVAEGSVLLEDQSYGAWAMLNDLHKGRNSGDVWSLFIDISAVVMLIFSLTGVWLIVPMKRRRQAMLSVCGIGLAAMFGFLTSAF